MAMDIDAVINALSPEEHQDLMKKGLCFYCKKGGHRVEDCNKKPPSNRSGNGGNQELLALLHIVRLESGGVRRTVRQSPPESAGLHRTPAPVQSSPVQSGQ